LRAEQFTGSVEFVTAIPAPHFPAPWLLPPQRELHRHRECGKPLRVACIGTRCSPFVVG